MVEAVNWRQGGVKSMAERNIDQLTGRGMPHRMGINFGSVKLEEIDIFGFPIIVSMCTYAE